MTEKEEIERIMAEFHVTEEDAKRILKDRRREIEVSIDTSNLEDVTKRLVKAEEERDDLKEKLSMVAEMRFREKKKALGCHDEDVNTVEELRAWSETHDKALRDADPIGRGGGGQALLSQASGVSEREFNSREELIDFLRVKANSGDKEAEAILNELFLKSSRGFTKQRKGETVYEDKSKIPLVDQINKGFREKVRKRIKEKKKEVED